MKLVTDVRAAPISEESSRIEQMAGKTIPALDAAISQIAPALSSSGKVLAQKIRWEIGRISKQTSVRILKSAR